MASFDGRLRVPGQARIPVSVVVDVTDERLAFSADGRSLGNWPLNSMNVVSLPDGFHLRLEDEEIVLTVSDPETFFGMIRKGSEDTPSLVPTRNGDRTIENRLRPTDPEEAYADLRKAVDRLSAAVLDDKIRPDQVFAKWLKLLKELNQRHGRGTLPTPIFYRLNTELLDLMPTGNSDI